MGWSGRQRFAALLGEGTADPTVLDDTVRAARERSPLVAALPEAEVRRHVRAIIDAAVAALLAGRPEGSDLQAAEDLGGDRARQGVPVAALLDGFQAGRSLIVRTLVERGRASGVSSDDLLEGLTRIDAIATALEHRMVHAHRIAELDMARTTRDTQVQRLRQLLHGEAGADGPRQVVVTDVTDPAVAQVLERALGGLAGLVDGRLAALVTRVPDLPGQIAVISPLVPPAQIPRMYGLCRCALRLGEPGLRTLTELALYSATATEPELGALLAAELLPGLDRADAFHREIAETVLAFLDHGSRVEATATALHVHPNTVKYRIRRLQQITGRPLDRQTVADTAHRWWALRSFLRS
ncbi:MAG: helix-turn-helix domain-containing protein [Streptosporangiaceae bacterium]